MNKKWIAAGITALAIAIIVSYFTYQTFFLTVMQPGGEAPLTGEIELEIVERELTEGAEMKVVEGEHLKATWNANWLNRHLTPYGGNNIAGLWFIDGRIVEMMTGSVTSINTTYCQGTNPTPGCISELQWNWRTLPIVATLPAEGGTTTITREITIDTTGLSKGVHQITIKAYMINGASEVGIFNCGTPNGVCCPLQTASQGFPCAGIYGTTQHRSKSYYPQCPSHPPPWGGTGQYWLCPDSMQAPSCTGGRCSGYCGNHCCENWGTGGGATTGLDGKLVVWCNDWGPARVWGGWSAWTQTVEQTEANIMVNALLGGETVAVIEFEIAEKCPNECCIGDEGYTDKICPQTNQICQNNTCITIKETCPYECCAGYEGHFDKDCSTGYACTPDNDEYACELQTIVCPFECCEQEPQYNNKACETGKYCENNECKTWTPLPQCGNGECETGETATTCPTDCDVQTTPECGNAICEENELETCPQDCEAQPSFPLMEIGIILYFALIAVLGAWAISDWNKRKVKK